ncbi:MAG: type IX secretion system membrane protein PorP/SprF [Tangfeifania sp.]
MKAAIKIGFLLNLLSQAWFLTAQEGKNMLPLSNKLLLNPSFAGWDKNTNVQTGLSFMSQSKKNLNHVFYLTYDTYSEKLKGGVGYYFYQGLRGSLNTNETGMGFTYSKTLPTGKGKSFVPSFNINYKLATKQWFVQMMEPLTPPGQELLRYNVILPKAGVLWDSPARQIGLSLACSIHIDMANAGEHSPPNIPEVIFYYSQLIEGKQKGLISRPFEMRPEIVVLYSGEIFLTRTLLQISDINHNYGLYIQNNFAANLHGIGTIYGWNFNRFKLNLSMGSAFNFESQNFAFFGEIALSLMLPYTHFDKKNPWSTPKKLF